MSSAPVIDLCLNCGKAGHADHLPLCPDTYGVTQEPKRATRPTWDQYFFALADLVASRATCPRAHIGCIIVDPASHRILGTGYNGAPPGQPHCDDEGCLMLADHCVRSVHAEVNAASQARWTLDGPRDHQFVAYVVGPRPVCSHCAAALHDVGVVEVRWREV